MIFYILEYSTEILRLFRKIIHKYININIEINKLSFYFIALF